MERQENYLFDDEEFRILRNYLKCHVVANEDRSIIERLASQSFMTLGFTECDDGSIEEIASLTPLGKRAYRRAYLNKTPILRQLYEVFSVLS